MTFTTIKNMNGYQYQKRQHDLVAKDSSFLFQPHPIYHKLVKVKASRRCHGFLESHLGCCRGNHRCTSPKELQVKRESIAADMSEKGGLWLFVFPKTLTRMPLETIRSQQSQNPRICRIEALHYIQKSYIRIVSRAKNNLYFLFFLFTEGQTFTFWGNKT